MMIDMQPRHQNRRPPTHRSKLSKQYMPSEDSDEDSQGDKASARRRSKYMSGAALELNISPRPEGTRARTHSNASSQTIPSDSTDSASLKSTKSATKKLSFGKRISTFFRGSANKSPNHAPVSSLTQSLSNAAAENTSTSRSTTPSLPPIDELTPPDRAHSVYIHQRSHSTPDHVGSTGYGHFCPSTHSGGVQNPIMTIEESRFHTARDSGFEEANGRGHRRHSSSTAAARMAGSHAASSPQLLPHQTASENQRSSLHRTEGLHLDQHQQLHRRFNNNVQLSTSSPQLPSHADYQLHLPAPQQRHNNRHSFMGMGTDTANYPSPTSSMPKRGSTPVGFASSSSSETLISKVDREKASVCFQAPSAKKDTFTRDTNLDPAFSSLVQQHRKDFKTNQRLGGTPQPSPQPHSPQFPGHSPRQRGSAYQDDPQQIFPPPGLTPGSRRDSSGSQHYYPPSPGLYASDTQMKRLSTGSQYLQHIQQQQQQHPNYPYPSINGNSSPGLGKHSGSQGSLSHQIQGGSYYHDQPFQQAPQGSPLSGPQKTSSPKRLSSAPGYFTTHQQQQQQQLQPMLDQQQHHAHPQPPLLRVSPFPSPSLGALPTATSPLPEFTIKQQQQQQQSQQLEQLQQIRIQQQHALLQQQQQLQQQLQQTRAAVAVTTAATLQQQQQQQLHQSAQVGLGLDMNAVQSLGVGLGNMMITTIPGAVSPFVLAPAVFPTPPPPQQQRSSQSSNNIHSGGTYAQGTVPVQTYPAGTGYR
ncbi:hypothetical protein BGX33_008893 [Mortierella sp. NVP41]|nr:hypothetical protein BGX33_008893 [Mortierella sp. NVP41]